MNLLDKIAEIAEFEVIDSHHQFLTFKCQERYFAVFETAQGDGTYEFYRAYLQCGELRLLPNSKTGKSEKSLRTFVSK
jgi:hypothetical protein